MILYIVHTLGPGFPVAPRGPYEQEHANQTPLFIDYLTLRPTRPYK